MKKEDAALKMCMDRLIPAESTVDKYLSKYHYLFMFISVLSGIFAGLRFFDII